MYVQSEYNKDWEQVGDKESVPVIFRNFRNFGFIVIFEPPQNTWDKNFRNKCTCGRDYLDAVEARMIKKDNVLVQLSLNSSQLYRDKDSDCWIFVYIIHNLAPDLHYEKSMVIPTRFIPGPEKMKDGDSFLYPLLYHISALQNEGLHIWDTLTCTHIPCSTPFLFVMADGPAMVMILGMVGHSGKFGCCLYCGLPGHCQDQDGHYFLKPKAYNVTGCNHEDIMFSDLKQYR
jgi:hypothetical protein